MLGFTRRYSALHDSRCCTVYTQFRDACGALTPTHKGTVYGGRGDDDTIRRAGGAGRGRDSGRGGALIPAARIPSNAAHVKRDFGHTYT